MDVELQLQSIHGEVKETFEGSITKISDKPADVIPGADFIVLCMPVCKYRIALHDLAARDVHPGLAACRQCQVSRFASTEAPDMEPGVLADQDGSLGLGVLVACGDELEATA